MGLSSRFNLLYLGHVFIPAGSGRVLKALSTVFRTRNFHAYLINTRRNDDADFRFGLSSGNTVGGLD